MGQFMHQRVEDHAGPRVDLDGPGPRLAVCVQALLPLGLVPAEQWGENDTDGWAHVNSDPHSVLPLHRSGGA